jgi:hypothetical protein
VPYKGDVNRNPNLSGANYGKIGYCKFCDLLNNRPDLRKPFMALVANGRYSKSTREWISQRMEMVPDRKTFYAHKDHSANGKDRLVSQVAAQRAKGVMPAKASAEDFLDAVVALGLQRAIDDPESITIDQALKAATAQMSAKAQRGGAQVTLNIALTTPLASEPSLLLGDGSIEGEVTEISDQ